MNIPKPILMTPAGLDVLKKEKERLEKERPAAVEDLKKAREMGDLSENGYYKSARFKLSSLDSRLRYLTHVVRFAKVQQVVTTDSVTIGATVHIEQDGKEIVYTIVGEHEANPSEGKISYLSPLGKAIMDKKVGEEVHTSTPKGLTLFKIKEIT